MRKISKRQFDAYCYARQPAILALAEEVDWYEAENKKLLAVVTRDKTDDDFGSVILGRDARKLFRAIEVCYDFCKTQAEAVTKLKKSIKKYENDGRQNYPQGDEKEAPNEIYNLVVKPEKVHSYFTILTEDPRFEAAKNFICEAIYCHIDVDGNYIQQFQSDGFDARLWELYLYIYFYNAGFKLQRKFPSPDFCISRFGNECFIEAVTVGKNPNFDVPYPNTAKEMLELSKDYLPIKFGSALYSKISRDQKYWELEHVAGKPFILAIHDYHVPAADGLPVSMTWSWAGLFSYLYGFRNPAEVVNGEILPKTETVNTKMNLIMEKVEEHTVGDKIIPANFFIQPDAENISAVLFSNAATVTAFNCMGKLAGLGSANVKMTRKGMKTTPKGSVLYPVPFIIDVDDINYEETWADSLVMFHNPRALHPVDPQAFPDISHVQVDPDTGECSGLLTSNKLFYSVTSIKSASVN